MRRLRTTHCRPTSPPPRRRLAGWLVLLCIWGLLPATGYAEEFSELQVLPKTTERRELMEIMRGFSRDLGVRCEHCHAGNAQMKISDFDFTSNANENKEVARQMMRMTQQINDVFLPKTGRKTLMDVTCATCHRGQPRPLSLEETLTQTLERDGLDAALAHYGSLREEWLGRASFDFGEPTLRRLAAQLGRQEQSRAAKAFLELNLEHFPDATLSLMQLASLQEKAGETSLAIATYRRVLTLEPDNSRARRKLSALQP